MTDDEANALCCAEVETGDIRWRKGREGGHGGKKVRDLKGFERGAVSVGWDGIIRVWGWA